jgi:tRNA 5-methylaminomethyl-2-thiouridine biosynthesis bifunctional protein
MKVTPSDMAYYQPDRRRPAPVPRRDVDPVLTWRDRATPASARFGDVYYAQGNGLAEARHTFLDGNGLPGRWSGQECFVIGETGFGTGLNFLAAWKCWRETARPGAILHYLSLEGFPLSRDQLKACLAPWSELAPLAGELIAAYPPPHDGFHRVWLDGGRVALTLLFGDAGEVLAEAEAQVDAWFLDGFAPARNPAMWSSAVFVEIARLSAPGATLASFTVAGSVRQGLQDVGFALEKRPGFGRKREMLTGRLGTAPSRSRLPPWYRLPPPMSRAGRPAIIGAGIAGCAVAKALSRRGIAARLVDRHDGIATEASGNPAALIAPRLDRGDSEAALFHDRAYRTALAEIEGSGLEWRSRGALHLAPQTEAPSRLWEGAITPLDPVEASVKAGVALHSRAFWFPQAGLIEPARLAERFASNTQMQTAAGGATLRRGKGTWQVLDGTGAVIDETDRIIVAAASASGGFESLEWLPVTPVLGQLSFVPQTTASRDLKTVLIWGGYLTPAAEGTHLLGATHERGDFDPARWQWCASGSGHERNHREMPPVVRTLFDPPDVGRWRGRASLRCALPDHLPAAGPVACAVDFLERFEGLKHGPRGRFPAAPAYHPGLFVLTGLGGRGITTAPLAAELLVSQMLGEPWPIERRLALALSPTRFLVRRARQGEMERQRA